MPKRKHNVNILKVSEFLKICEKNNLQKAKLFSKSKSLVIGCDLLTMESVRDDSQTSFSQRYSGSIKLFL
jgi:hypothetical protein